MTTPFSTGVTKLSKQIERILFFFFISPRFFSFLLLVEEKRKERERGRESEILFRISREFLPSIIGSRRDKLLSLDFVFEQICEPND